MPYTYLIGWSKLNLWYYGSEYAYKTKVAHPNNLWTTYFTSSKLVKYTREICGEPDVVQIRRIFDTQKACQLWEDKVLKKMNVMNDEKWLNKTNNVNFNGMTDYQRLQISKAMKGKKRKNFKKTDAFMKSCLNNVLKATEAIRGKPKSLEWRQKMTTKINGMYGKKHSEETKIKMKIAKARRRNGGV